MSKKDFVGPKYDYKGFKIRKICLYGTLCCQWGEKGSLRLEVI